MKVQTLSKAAIMKIVDYNEIIDEISKGFADYASGKAVIPPVTNIDIQENRGEVHIKSCHITGYDHYCIKIASGFFDNPKLGLEVGNGLMLLFNSKTGALSAIIFDEGYLTDLRTAAAGAVAAKHLTPDRQLRAAMIGAGVQGRLQIEFLAKVRVLEKINIWGIDEDERAAYIDEMSAKLPGILFNSCLTPSDAAAKTDIVIAATPSREPLIKQEVICPGMHITALGSDGPEKQEIDEKAFQRFDKIVLDHTEQCANLGELHHALVNNIVTLGDVYSELGNIVTGEKPGRETSDEITFCDLTGVGIQDIAISNWALNKAQQAGLVKEMEF